MSDSGCFYRRMKLCVLGRLSGNHYLLKKGVSVKISNKINLFKVKKRRYQKRIIQMI